MESDTELLSRFVNRRSEDAFGALVHRYTRMVHATCLRRLVRTPMAEDAAQAVFVVLAKKAKSIRSGTPKKSARKTRSAIAEPR